MRYLAWFFWIPFILIFLGFTILNNYQVTLNLWVLSSPVSTPLPILLFIVLVVGFLWGYLMARLRSFFRIKIKGAEEKEPL